MRIWTILAVFVGFSIVAGCGSEPVYYQDNRSLTFTQVAEEEGATAKEYAEAYAKETSFLRYEEKINSGATRYVLSHYDFITPSDFYKDDGEGNSFRERLRGPYKELADEYSKEIGNGMGRAMQEIEMREKKLAKLRHFITGYVESRGIQLSDEFKSVFPVRGGYFEIPYRGLEIRLGSHEKFEEGEEKFVLWGQVSIWPGNSVERRILGAADTILKSPHADQFKRDFLYERFRWEVRLDDDIRPYLVTIFGTADRYVDQVKK